MTEVTTGLSNTDFAALMRSRRHRPLAPIPAGALIWDGEIILKDPETGYLHPNAHPDDILRSAVPALGTGTPEDPGCVLKVHTYTPIGKPQRTMISYFPRHNGMKVTFEILRFIWGPEALAQARAAAGATCTICNGIDIPEGESCAICGREGE